MAIIATQATVYYASAVFYQNEAAGSLAAWKAAILTKDGSGRYRINADGALVRVMHAYNAWSGMTSLVVERASGVEQASAARPANTFLLSIRRRKRTQHQNKSSPCKMQSMCRGRCNAHSSYPMPYYNCTGCMSCRSPSN